MERGSRGQSGATLLLNAADIVPQKFKLFKHPRIQHILTSLSYLYYRLDLKNQRDLFACLVEMENQAEYQDRFIPEIDDALSRLPSTLEGGGAEVAPARSTFFILAELLTKEEKKLEEEVCIESPCESTPIRMANLIGVNMGMIQREKEEVVVVEEESQYSNVVDAGVVGLSETVAEGMLLIVK